MARKKSSEDEKKIKPVVKKRRTPSPKAQSEKELLNEEELLDQDSTDEENPDGEGGEEFDHITAPRESIFKNRPGIKGRFDGDFNDFTDGVIFNPSEPPVGFDSEWVRFLNQLSADETTKSMADYIRIAPLTRRAKYKLMIYIKTLLDREFSMSNVVDSKDMDMLNLDKLLIDADLPLGLTRFDMSPEFQHIINLVRIKFGIKTRRSLFGFERLNVNTQRTVQESNESSGGGMEVKKNIRDRIKDLFRGD